MVGALSSLILWLCRKTDNLVVYLSESCETSVDQLPEFETSNKGLGLR